MSKPTIADSAIYQYTVSRAEKYKAQRDGLLIAIKSIANSKYSTLEGMKSDLINLAYGVEQSL